MQRKSQLAQAAVKQRPTPDIGCFHKKAELLEMLPLVHSLWEMFNMFDPADSTGIRVGDVGHCLHAMGLAPIQFSLHANMPQSCQNRLSFENVLTMYCKMANVDGGPKAPEVLRALRAWDVEQRGIIPYSELRKMLTTIAEPIDASHVFGVLECVTDIEGNVHYEDLVANMYAHDENAKETLRQAHCYLQALGRNAVDVDMVLHDEFIDDLREADPDRSGYIAHSKLLELLNRNENSFTARELDIITDTTKSNARTDKGIDYHRFLRYIMDT
ncbi:uncharacterized protein LOC111072775 [Drosophila obscura]|uniref:uncharacterized protein LOC111072775 n=1 Tax=Drosophila obscura TaxID=7282 RepID=UPI001BB21D87|nr:uncharacterized protein LOC111072775 [Drosophila obscura]